MSIRHIDLGLGTTCTRSRARLIRDLMLTAGAAIGFSGGFSGIAQAQTAPAAPATTDASAQPADPQAADSAGEITITGYRQSIEASLRTKREANAFIDVITAEDVGKFPDKNVADALQRVPGVIISRDGGEGSRVSIRGLNSDLTLTELNGNFIAGTDSGDPSRSFNYLLLPSSMGCPMATPIRRSRCRGG